MITYTTVNPQNYAAPNAPLALYNQVDKSIKYIRVLNNSPFQLAVALDGIITNITEFWEKDIAVPSYFQGNLIITPSIAILTASHAQASQLTVMGLTALDGGGTLDGAIPQQAVTATASGAPIFSATVGFGSTAGTEQHLNIFNPPNSGVTYTFHSARFFTNDTTTPACNLLLISGADLNLPLAVPAVSHNGMGTPPTSTAHCTAQDGNSGYGGTIIEVVDAETGVTLDFLAFPDNYQLQPGNNLRITLTSGTSGHTVRLTMKWSESQLTLPTVVNDMATQTAANIVNDGNAPGTGLIEATPSGGAGQAIYSTNDGQLLWKILQSGVLHQVLNFQSSGNPQLGQLGDILEFLGSIQIDGGSTAHNGSVGGQVTFYVPIWGNGLKVLLVLFGNYNSAANFSFTLPSTIGRGLWLASYNGSSTCAFGNVDVATSLGNGTARGGDISESQIFANSFGSLQITSASTFTVNSTGGVAVNGAALVIGV